MPAAPPLSGTVPRLAEGSGPWRILRRTPRAQRQQCTELTDRLAAMARDTPVATTTLGLFVVHAADTRADLPAQPVAETRADLPAVAAEETRTDLPVQADLLVQAAAETEAVKAGPLAGGRNSPGRTACIRAVCIRTRRSARRSS